MKVSINLINIIFIAGLILNSYKIFLMPMQPYNIFPWSSEDNPAKSSPFWLIYHLITSLLLLCASRYWYICTNKMRIIATYDDTIMDSYVYIILSHILFTIGIIPNLSNLGCNSGYLAFIINTTILTGLTWALYKSRPLVYFILLNIPIFSEIISLLLFLI
jgi:hypothetical protein